ncbi:unnamed protein product, partial [Ixodes persulcatus]
AISPAAVTPGTARLHVLVQVESCKGRWLHLSGSYIKQLSCFHSSLISQLSVLATLDLVKRVQWERYVFTLFSRCVCFGHRSLRTVNIQYTICSFQKV